MNPDFANVVFGQQVAVLAPGVLANDIPSTTGDTLTVYQVNESTGNVGQSVGGQYGSLQLFANGQYTYTASGYSALPSSGVSVDFFGYTALEQGPGGGGSASSTLSVLVTAPGLTVVGAGQSNTTIQGRPVLDGRAGNDILLAGKGATVLVGGDGDTLTGNAGADTFLFMGNFGKNTITNLNVNKDIIQLSKADFGTDPTLIKFDATQAAGSANTVITDPVNHDTITLTGVQLSSLHFDASHFLLA